MAEPDMPNLRGRRIAACAMAGVAAAGACWLYGHPPSAAGSWYPPCVFHALTGLQCPGCGATRAAYALLHGHIAEAVHQNALAIAALPFVGFAASRALLRWTRDLAPPPFAEAQRRSVRLTLLLAPLVVVFGIVRNLPWSPFNLLAPY